MVVSTLRPLLLLLAGAVVGSLITFGVFNLNRKAAVQAGVRSVSQSELLPPKTLRVPTESEEDEEEPGNAATANADTRGTSNPQETSASQMQVALKIAQQKVPMRPIPKPTMVLQANGLPVGVTPDAGISDAYKRLPGIQPPLINRDGRDLGPEALQMLQNRQEVPFPGGVPSASATPMPFPSSVEEANRQAQSYSSPSPVQQ
jgi:hypothetical protein